MLKPEQSGCFVLHELCLKLSGMSLDGEQILHYLRVVKLQIQGECTEQLPGWLYMLQTHLCKHYGLSKGLYLTHAMLLELTLMNRVLH